MGWWVGRLGWWWVRLGEGRRVGLRMLADGRGRVRIAGIRGRGTCMRMMRWGGARVGQGGSQSEQGVTWLTMQRRTPSWIGPFAPYLVSRKERAGRASKSQRRE